MGVISTGDELVPPEAQPGPGQVRDVNSPMLEAMLSTFGCMLSTMGLWWMMRHCFLKRSIRPLRNVMPCCCPEAAVSE